VADEILVNCGVNETRIALLESGTVQEISIERHSRHSRVGSIFKGRVCRVLPGMQAAFVEIGLERAAFIHVNELVAPSYSEDGVIQAPPCISTILKENDCLIAQVLKDQIGSKGARLTTHLSFPSHYLVLLPQSSHVGISQRIQDPIEADRLRDLMTHFVQTQDVELGVIVRTAADGIGEDVLLADFQFLCRLWKTVQEKFATSKIMDLVHQDLPLYLRCIRDMVRPNIDRVLIDSPVIFEEISQFINTFMPEYSSKLVQYQGDRALFEWHQVEDELKKALLREVSLKSGGYLVIDQTEAMTTIDVNTGGFVGHRNLEETIFKTNLEATQAIARQLRLRNLGGIIIIDFIDMKDLDHIEQVMQNFNKALERDRTKTRVLPVSELGLLQMTRKRIHDSLERLLCEPCVVCSGRGRLKTAETLCFEIIREIWRENRIFQASRYMIIASNAVVERFLDEESAQVADLELQLNCQISFQVEPMYSQEQYDVVLM
jgi:ribonuclease G